MPARSGRRRLLPFVLTAIVLLLSGLHADAPGDLIASSSWTGSGEEGVAADLTAAAGELMERQRQRLGLLAEGLATAPDSAARLRIEREVRRVKLETERDLFLIQLEHAVASGNGAAEEEIRSHLDVLDRFLEGTGNSRQGTDEPATR